MDIENISQIDFFIRSYKNKNLLLEVDNLIIIDANLNSINKFKNSTYQLNEICQNINNSEMQQTWQNLFNKQVKYSVNRIKEKKQN